MRPGVSALPALLLVAAAATGAAAAPACERPVYLTFDTGHMAVAPLIAEVLKRHDVKATFFVANERTKSGGSSLDDEWASWWHARVEEGHAFGSHTWDHHVWRADLPDGRMRFVPTAGPQAGRPQVLDAQQLCAEIKRPVQRLRALGAQAATLPLWRAPGGKTSPRLLAAARACGYTHVGWAEAGFLGDELPSERWPNEQLLQKALRDIRPGDILLAHLGIWSRRDPWAPAVLEPLITGLKARGLCFATLREHPQYGSAR